MKSEISRQEILNGPIIKTMMKLGWPVMAGTVLQTTYQLADTFWLGNLSGDESGTAVASLQTSFPLIWFFVAFIVGFAVSGTALVSQYSGADNRDSANFAASQVFSFNITLGVVGAIAGFFLMPLILPLITKEADIVSASTKYLRLFVLGLPFMFTTGIFRILFAASGNTKTPMYVAIFTNILNIVIDPFFIKGIGPLPAMGIEGAALATIISQFAGASAAVYIMFFKSHKLSLSFSSLIPSWKWFLRIFKIGFPAAIGHSLESMGFVILTGIIGRLPDPRTALGAYGVANRIIHLVFIAVTGLAQGLTTMVGQSLGYGDKKRATTVAFQGIGFLVIILIVQAAVLVLLRYELLSFFVPGEEDIIREGSYVFLYFVPLGVPLFGFIRGVSAVFNAAGKNIPVMIISMFRLWVFRLPIVIIFSTIATSPSKGIWIGMGLSNLLTGILALFFFMKGGWKKGEIHAEKQHTEPDAVTAR